MKITIKRAFIQRVFLFIIIILSLLILLNLALSVLYAIKVKSTIIPDKLLFFKLKPNSLNYYEPDRWIKYKINSKGLRDYEYSYSKDNGSTRILMLGDSVIFGPNIDIEETYPKLLEERLRLRSKSKFDVINTGVPGYNLEQEIFYLSHEGVKYNSDIVILNFVLNDFPSKERSWQYDAQNVANSVNDYYKYLNSTIKIVLYAHLLTKRFEPAYSTIDEKAISWEKLNDSFKEFKELSEKHNFQPIIVIFPFLNDFENYPYNHIHSKLNQIAAQNNISSLDLYPYLKDYDAKELGFRTENVHYNKKGLNIVTQIVYDFLQKQSE